MRRAMLPALLVACLWLNQGVSRAHLEVMRARLFPAPAADAVESPVNVAELVWYPFAFAYHRALDEQLYFDLSGVMLGLPADRSWPLTARGKALAAFEAELPPADGRWHAPYVEVPLEYPPMAVPFLVAPRLVTADFETYARLLGLLMGLALTGAVAIALRVAQLGGASARETRRAGWLAAALLLAEGSLVVQRLDAIPALFLTAMVLAAARRRHLLFGVLAGLAIAAKLIPALIVPALLAADLETWRDGRARLRAALGLGATVALGLGPMLLAPGALGAVLGYHARRGLQIESTLGAIWGVVRMLAGRSEPSTLSFGSMNFSDPVANVLARATGPMTLLVAAVVAWTAWRAHRVAVGAEVPARAERLALAALAATVALWLSGKVLSPQYLTWGIPLVLAVPGRRGLVVAGWLFAALVLTQVYLRGYYPAVIAQEPVGVITVFVRQAVLVALLVTTMRYLLTRRAAMATT